MASEKIQNILEEIKALSLIEANELKNAICEEFGVSADAPVMVAGAAAAAPAAATKDSWDVILTGAGETKMTVIKVVKEITGLGLKESKEIVDNVPKAVKEGVSESEADEIKKKLEEAGASVEVKYFSFCKAKNPSEDGFLFMQKKTCSCRSFYFGISIL